ncbi:MAG TPA: hypothetical protein VL172_02565 [Kofleriaceae bacterium]|nr:hypothetical protein [Kofleriaceae bacterium]
MVRGCLLALALLAPACDDSSPSCELTMGDTLLVCIDYGGPISVSDARASCQDNGGSWQESACDSGDAVARCELFGSSTWYYAPYVAQTGTTFDMLRADCEQTGGTFTQL